ncbi:MAG: AgmX/PglI C-terminal domain-containing protein [Archangium sp.]|nr:AgmX/PglI C-terminal domain-containing protein [Archangium sp.]
MIFELIQEGGIGAYAAIALGALGCLLGASSIIAALGKSRAAFALGVTTLVIASATAGAGMLGTVYGRSQVERALGHVSSGLDRERLHHLGFREAQSSSWVGFFAALLPLALGGAAALLGSRLQRPHASRVQGFAEPVVSSDEGPGQTVMAGVFVAMAALATGGAWAMAHGELPKLRFSFDATDSDAWALAGALEDVQGGRRPNGCARLADALDRYWDASDRREWPRRFRREIPGALSGWRAGADGCAKQILESLDTGGLEPGWTQDGLLDSVLLQDDGLRTRALEWTAKSPEAPPSPMEPRVGSGSLPKEAIANTIRADLKAIRLCYERELTKAPGLEGKVVVKFLIGADGRVQSVEDASDEPFPSQKVTTCVLARFEGMKFPRPSGGGVVIVKYPFIFKSAD